MIKPNKYVILIGILAIFVSIFIRWSAIASSVGYAANSQNITVHSQNHHTEYALSSGTPLNIVIEAPGRVWYTLPSLNKIGSLIVPQVASSTPASPQAIDYTVPSADSEPYDLAYANGFIWFTQRQANQIGRLEIATGQIDEFMIPTPNSSPRGIVIARNGHIWFTEYATNQIGRFNPVTETFTEYPYIGPLTEDYPRLGFTDLAITSQNRLWLTASESDHVLYFDPSANLFYSISTPQGSRPLHIVLDSGGSPWITTANANLIGRYTPGTLSYWHWHETTNVNGPGGIALRETGTEQQVVFAQPGSNQVGQLKLDFSDASLTTGHYGISGANNQPSGVAIDEHGTVWIADAATGRIFEWKAPYFSFVYLPVIQK